MNRKTSHAPAGEDLSLSKAAQIILDECRMLLPGIQALFGFQLIAVFNQVFSEKLSSLEQQLHLLAIGLVVLTTIIIMTPAAYHRQMEVQKVTQDFIHLATTLMLVSMIPLAISICLEFYLVGQIILGNTGLAVLLSIGLFMMFFVFWIALPRTSMLRRLLGNIRR